MSTRSTWTRETALAAGAAFVAREGCLPTSEDCQVSQQIPHWNALRRLFGSLNAYLHLLPAPVVPPKPAMRTCLSCDVRFQPDHDGLHVCDACKRGEAWQADSADVDWANGAVGAAWWHE